MDLGVGQGTEHLETQPSASGHAVARMVTAGCAGKRAFRMGVFLAVQELRNRSGPARKLCADRAVAMLEYRGNWGWHQSGYWGLWQSRPMPGQARRLWIAGA